MNNIAVILPLAIAFMFGVMMLTTFGGNITRYFNLVDKRSFLTKESWEKVNALMVAGDFSMYASDGMDGNRWNRISVGYNKSKNESVSKSFNGVDINLMVDEAFDWAQKEGYLVKPQKNEK